ncbi:MAG: hypothetical protein H7251_17610, partial [Acetobacteraceae bacterium]|nr:hypothetical protein [Acetobacteraceae bacterium]
PPPRFSRSPACRTPSTSTGAIARAGSTPIIFSPAASQGGSAHGDGKSALLYPTSASHTSIELMETRAPILVVEKSLVPRPPAWRPGGADKAAQTR